MDIQQAKQQIKYTMQAYFAKDEFGGYALPPQRQRPIFLLGPASAQPPSSSRSHKSLRWASFPTP